MTTFDGIDRAIADIASRARSNGLKPDELAGGTFTITNIGSEGALTDTPILVPPQAAMIGTGAIVKRPVVLSEDEGEAIAIRQMVFLPMTYDHQVIDGADARRYPTLPLVVGKGADVAAGEILPLLAQRPRLMGMVDALVRVDERRWDLRLKDGSLIQLPAIDQEAALIRLDALDQRERLLDLGFARVDLRTPEEVAVRPSGDA